MMPADIRPPIPVRLAHRPTVGGLVQPWVNVVLAQAEKAFQRTGGPPRREQAQLTAKVERLEAKLVQKNEVIAELLEENVKTKKEAGEL